MSLSPEEKAKTSEKFEKLKTTQRPENSVGLSSVKSAIGQVSNTVQISSINYSTNTITLSSPMTWANNTSVWLYKKSDGAVVLLGSAPDQGAYEGHSLAPPKNLRILGQ